MQRLRGQLVGGLRVVEEGDGRLAGQVGGSLSFSSEGSLLEDGRGVVLWSRGRGGSCSRSRAAIDVGLDGELDLGRARGIILERLLGLPLALDRGRVRVLGFACPLGFDLCWGLGRSVLGFPAL